MKKTIKEMAANGKVYVYLSDEAVGERFLQQAEQEGFTFSDGAKPTSRHYSDIMAVNPDGTINYVGSYGRMAFGANAVNKIDYQRFSDGYDDYMI